MNGLFDPRREHDACGVGFVAYLDGQSRHDVMHMALGAMTRMAHRGGGDGRNGDGAGIRCLNTGEDLQERRFSRAVDADHADALALV